MNENKNKNKSYKCKICCSVETFSRNELYRHKKEIHFERDKSLSCPHCEFATVHKHHLVYHLARHRNSKPIHCEVCDYKCANKAMLLIHHIKHSDRKPYHCGECEFTSKYKSSMMNHLKNKGHRSAKIVNEDGSEDPIVPCASRWKRRSKMVRQGRQALQEIHPPQQCSVPSNDSSQSSSPRMEYTPSYALETNLHRAYQALSYNSNRADKQALQRLIAETEAELKRRHNSPHSNSIMFPDLTRFQVGCANQTEIANGIELYPCSSSLMRENQDERQPQFDQFAELQRICMLTSIFSSSQAEDHSLPPLEMDDRDQNHGRDAESAPLETSDQTSPVNSRWRKSWRKGRALKCVPDEAPVHDVTRRCTEIEIDHNQNDDLTESTGVVEQEQADEDYHNNTPHYRGVNPTNITNKENTCRYCGIDFNDVALHTIHMGFHARGPHPFMCNFCGKQCENKIEFQLHLTRRNHEHDS